MEELKKEINQIKERNKKVELDKAWETSLERKVLVAGLTYLVILLFFVVIGQNRPFISAVVPTLGFFLSTLTIGFAKNLWIRRRNKK